MTEAACINDLLQYELARADWLQTHNGAVDGFQCNHGALLEETVVDNESLKAHLEIPSFIGSLELTSENRRRLGESLNGFTGESDVITDSAIAEARDYVSRLFGLNLTSLSVIRAPSMVMDSKAIGAVYSCNVKNHVIVVPESSFDPFGILVRQFAIAAHYTLMREKGTLAAMVSDPLTQALVGNFALLTFAAEHPDKCTVMSHLQMLVSWEFAKGLSKTPTMPLGFVASDLGERLIRDYGAGMFKAVLADLYDSMAHGRAIWFGSNNFSGMALALAVLGDNYGVSQLMRIDAGDRTLEDKLKEAFPGITGVHLAGFNAPLARIIATASEAA